MEWISVKERLPERGIHVLGAIHDPLITRSHDLITIKLVGDKFLELFNNNEVEGGDLYKVTHWMPLPEPPK